MNYGYDNFLKTKKLGWTHEETPEDWRKMMSSPDEFGQYEWGDDEVLQLATNVLSVDVVIIPAFKESAGHRACWFTFNPVLSSIAPALRPLAPPRHAYDLLGR